MFALILTTLLLLLALAFPTTALTALTYTALTTGTLLSLTQTLLLAAHLTAFNPLEFYARSLASFLCLFLCAAYGTLASYALTLAGRGGLGQWTTARAFKWTMWAFTRVWFEIEDPEGWLGATRPAVLLGNHQTELDVLMLGHVFPRYCSVTAKSSLRFWPFLGQFMSLSKTVFIERKSRSQALAAFDAAAKQMHTDKQSVFIFPEGTRSYAQTPMMLPFKKGAFHLAIQAQVPLIPVVAANYSAVLDPKRKVFKSGTIPVRVMKPISMKGKTKEDVDALLEEVRSGMLRELEGMMGRAREKGVAVQQPMGMDGVSKGLSSGVDAGLNDAAAHPVVVS